VGVGCGGWVLGRGGPPHPPQTQNPQSPIPNPQYYNYIKIKIRNKHHKNCEIAFNQNYK